MANPFKKAPSSSFMPRQESALWLGRALSTNELTLRVTLELLDMITFQQRLIQELYERVRPASGDGQPGGLLAELEQGSTDKILAKLDGIRQELDPALKAVDEACRKLEGMI